MDVDAIFNALIIAAIIGLIRHIVGDIETRKELEALKKRVSKLDGINGR